MKQNTVNEAKKNIAGIVSRKVGTKWMWSIPNEDCNIAEVSAALTELLERKRWSDGNG